MRTMPMMLTSKTASEPMTRQEYDSNKFWRERYIELLHEFAQVNNELIDRVASLEREVKYYRRKARQLEAKNWQHKTGRGKGRF